MGRHPLSVSLPRRGRDCWELGRVGVRGAAAGGADREGRDDENGVSISLLFVLFDHGTSRVAPVIDAAATERPEDH